MASGNRDGDGFIQVSELAAMCRTACRDSIKCGAELSSVAGAKEPFTNQLMGETGHNRSHPDTDDQTACASAHIKSHSSSENRCGA